MHFINETFSLIKLGASMSRQRSRGICQKSMQFKYNLINIRMNKRNKRSFSTQTTSKYMPPLSISVQMHSVGIASSTEQANDWRRRFRYIIKSMDGSFAWRFDCGRLAYKFTFVFRIICIFILFLADIA